MPVVQIVIDDSTSKVITGTYNFDRASGGILCVPSGTAFPGTPEACELFWRTDEDRLYRRDDGNTTWETVTAAPSVHALGGSDHSADTLANLNAKVSDATLDDSSATRDPNAHGSAAHTGTIGDHSQLSSVGADDHHAQNHAASHVNGTDDIQDASGSQKGLATAAQITKLSGIETGAEVNNISDANATALTGAGDTVLHYHANDRNRANHTGTQAASTISDFDTEVSNNADVAANTTHRGDTSNPHGTDLGNLGSGTLAELNSKVTDATLDDSSASRSPTAHGSAAHTGTIGDHSQLSSVGADDHHAQAHVVDSANHTTTETDTSKRLAPNGSGGVVWAAGGGASVAQTYQFFADMLEHPLTSDWPVNALAPVAVDSLNTGLLVARFDDTLQEGKGFSIYVPSGALTMTLRFMSRAQTAPAAVRTVGLKLYERGMPGVVDAWSVGVQLTDINIPASANWVYDYQEDTLANWGLTAGQVHQFELVRVAPTGGTNLVGDWTLRLISVEFG